VCSSDLKFLNDLKKPSAGVLRKQQKMLPGQCLLLSFFTAVVIIHRHRHIL